MPQPAFHKIHNRHLNRTGTYFSFVFAVLAVLLAWNALLPDTHNDHALSCSTSRLKCYLFSGTSPTYLKFHFALPSLSPPVPPYPF